MSTTLAKELDLHEQLQQHITRKLILPEEQAYTSSLYLYPLPSASSYATINGDEKLAHMRITLRAIKKSLGVRKDFIPYQQCYVELVVAGSLASANSGEEPFLIGIRQFRVIVRAEKNRLKAIESARKDLGKEYLWPRWGTPRTRGAGKEGCLKEIRHSVYKRRGRADVVSTCLDRRGFREVIICDNCESIPNRNPFTPVDFVQLGLEYGRQRKALWDQLKSQGKAQGAAPNNEDWNLYDDPADSSDEEDFTDLDDFITDSPGQSHGREDNVRIYEDPEVEDVVSGDWSYSLA